MAIRIYHTERYVQADLLRNLREQVPGFVSIFRITLGTASAFFFSVALG